MQPTLTLLAALLLLPLAALNAAEFHVASSGNDANPGTKDQPVLTLERAREAIRQLVRRSGEKVRVTAQFIDAITGYHLWAERFDRDLKDIFTLQDEITLQIMKSVHEKLELKPTRRSGRGAMNVESFLKTMEGLELLLRAT